MNGARATHQQIMQNGELLLLDTLYDNKWCEIGPRQLAIPELQNRHAGEQEIQWRELSDWLGPVGPLLSNMAVL